MKKTSTSIHLIFVFSRIIYLITILFCVLGAISAISLTTGLFTDDLNMVIGLPLESGSEVSGKAYFLGEEINVVYGDARGRINFIDVPQRIAVIYASFVFIMVPFSLYLVHVFYRFIYNVKKGLVFDFCNYKLLRKLGITLLGLYGFVLVSSQLWKIGFSAGQTATNVKLNFGGNIYILLAALFILMLSQVFLKGLELKHENELTV